MKFLIISHVKHKKLGDKYFGYGPYVKEMNLWLKYVNSVEIVAPLLDKAPDKIDLPYVHNKIKFTKVPSFNLIGLKNKILTLIMLPLIFIKILFAMKRADHIHLRCPGNMGLLGSIAQIFFPSKIKTVKYAGNWDPNSIQPKSYVLQKKIMSNPKFSKNTKVLVYGDWKNQTKNIKPFFTATYSKNEIENIEPRVLDTKIELLFVGSLSKGKRPMLALETIKSLKDKGLDIHLNICGEGIERENLEKFIKLNSLENNITLHGNQNSEFVKNMYKKSHFLILVSKSEGWPKVVAEAMFWGCVPISSNVSCVEHMMGYGSRGRLVSTDINKISSEIEKLIHNKIEYEKLSRNGIEWSREYTLESFENAIKDLLNEK